MGDSLNIHEIFKILGRHKNQQTHSYRDTNLFPDLALLRGVWLYGLDKKPCCLLTGSLCRRHSRTGGHEVRILLS